MISSPSLARSLNLHLNPGGLGNAKDLCMADLDQNIDCGFQRSCLQTSGVATRHPQIASHAMSALSQPGRIYDSPASRNSDIALVTAPRYEYLEVWPGFHGSIHRLCTLEAQPHLNTLLAQADSQREVHRPCWHRESASYAGAQQLDKRLFRLPCCLREREVDAEPQLLPDATRPPAVIDVPWGPKSEVKVDMVLGAVAMLNSCIGRSLEYGPSSRGKTY